jgi:hypothetical protein
VILLATPDFGPTSQSFCVSAGSDRVRRRRTPPGERASNRASARSRELDGSWQQDRQMALIECPDCKKRISDSTRNCPGCGYALAAEKAAGIDKKQEAWKRGSLGCLPIVALIMWIGPWCSPSKKTTTDEKRLDPSQKPVDSIAAIPKDEIPADATYTIEDQPPSPNGNRWVHVHLDRKVSEAAAGV